jgi:hypothetical protein
VEEKYRSEKKGRRKARKGGVVCYHSSVILTWNMPTAIPRDRIALYTGCLIKRVEKVISTHTGSNLWISYFQLKSSFFSHHTVEIEL